MKHKTLYACWNSGGVLNHLKMHDCTTEEVAKTAIEMGYRPPKWYEFWKKEIVISDFLYYESNHKDEIELLKSKYSTKSNKKYQSYSDYE